VIFVPVRWTVKRLLATPLGRRFWWVPGKYAGAGGPISKYERPGTLGSPNFRFPTASAAARRKAIRSFPLRLHSGLRQSGAAFGRVIFARWKPGPFEAVVGPEGRAGAGRALRDVTHLKSEMGTPNLGVADQMWATR